MNNKALGPIEKLLTFFVPLYCVTPFLASAHDIPVHEAITSAAVSSAAQWSQGYQQFYNLISPLGQNVKLLDGDTGASLTPRSWMIYGSAQEDNYLTDDKGQPDNGKIRSYNHFYDPLAGKGLWNFAPDLPWATIGQPSFVWASTLNGAGVDLTFPPIPGIVNVNTFNQWSWPNARDLQMMGLTSFVPADRAKNLARMYRALGQVVHLLEDTSQPQHVRNEQHLDKYQTIWLSPIEKYGNDNVNTLQYTRGILDWRTDGFTKMEDFWDRDLYTGNAQALINSDDVNQPTKKVGLAEFSNGNFVGERHTYAELMSASSPFYYPLPSLNNGTDWNSLLAHPSQYGKITSLFSYGTFDGTGYRFIVGKTASQGRAMNHHAAVSYLVGSNPQLALPPGIHSVTIDDPDVMKDYHDNLIPEAVKYSAGLIDYFFRGMISVDYVWNGTAYQIQIVNQSGEDFGAGSFTLWQDSADGNRSSVPLNLNYPGSLLAGAEIDGTFAPPTATSQYLIVFQGTIGTVTGTTTALDDVDNRAVAVKAFTVVPPTCAATVANIPGPPSDYDNYAGIFTTTTADFSVPSPGQSVQVTVQNAAGVIVGEGDIVSGAGEFQIVGFTTSPNPETLTLQNKGLVSNVPAGTRVSSGTAIHFREDLEPFKAVYVPSVNRVFVNASWDTILVIDPDNLTLENWFHVSNLIDDYAPSLAYAADVDRLYVLSKYGGVYVINPNTEKVETVIPKPAISQISAYDGFYDPVNHRVGFGYWDNGPSLLLINTPNNSIAADITGASDIAAEYSAIDNRIYAANGSIISVYSGSDLSLITTLQAPGRILELRYSALAAKVYGRGGSGGFYIYPLGTYFNTTTAPFTVPANGATVTVTTADTSGMIVGQSVSINDVGWTITAVHNGTLFDAQNRNSLTQGTVIATGATLSWGGPQYISLPIVGSVGGLFNSMLDQTIVFTGTTQSATELFDPVHNSIICTIPNSNQDDLFYGCEGPGGKLFVPYLQTISPFAGGVYVIH